MINPILHIKIYIPVIHLSIRHDYAYHRYSALSLLRIFIIDFKRTNRRISLQNRLITLHLFLRLRYEILKRWEIDLLKHVNHPCHVRQLDLNNHFDLYSALDYLIYLFSMILIDSNSRTGSYEFKTNFVLIRIIILLTHFKSIMSYHDLLGRQASTRYSDVEILLQTLTISLRTF